FARPVGATDAAARLGARCSTIAAGLARTLWPNRGRSSGSRTGVVALGRGSAAPRAAMPLGGGKSINLVAGPRRQSWNVARLDGWSWGDRVGGERDRESQRQTRGRGESHEFARALGARSIVASGAGRGVAGRAGTLQCCSRGGMSAQRRSTAPPGRGAASRR